MFDKIYTNYEAKKKTIEKNNGKLNIINIIIYLFIKEQLKKNLRNLNDPLTKEILSGLNDV